jgi:DNA-binding HxlR family transcriptional regulator
MYKRKNPVKLDCSVYLAREVLYGKWKVGLIHYIGQGVKRPGALQRRLPGSNRKVLAVQLNELFAAGLISRKVYAELPPKVEYTLTEFGETLLPVIKVMGEWGDCYRERLQEVLAEK